MPYRPEECACPPSCPVRCTPDRSCDDLACACYQLWSLEIDLLAEQKSLLPPKITRGVTRDGH